MIFFKKKLLPLLLVSCIGVSVVHTPTCEAGFNLSSFIKTPVGKIAAVGLVLVGALISRIPNKIVRNWVFGSFALGVFVCGLYYVLRKRSLDITNLSDACKKGDYDKAKAILDYNKNKNGLDKEIISGCLHCACQYGDLKLVKLLVERLKDKELGDEELYGSVLDCACQNTKTGENGNNEGDKIFEYLLEMLYKGLDYSKPETKNILYPLHVACKNKKLELVKWLLEEKRLDVNLKCNYSTGAFGRTINKHDVTPLHVACLVGDSEIVEYLFNKNGKNFNLRTKTKELPIHWVCMGKGDVNFFKKVFQNYYKKQIGLERLDDSNSDDQALIWFAVQSGNLELFNYLAPKYDPALINKDKRDIAEDWHLLAKVEWDISNGSVLRGFSEKNLLELAFTTKNMNWNIIEKLSKYRQEKDEKKVEIITKDGIEAKKTKTIKFTRDFTGVNGFVEIIKDIETKFEGLKKDFNFLKKLTWKKISEEEPKKPEYEFEVEIEV